MSGGTVDNSSESPPQVTEPSNPVDQSSSTSYTISRSTNVDGKPVEKTISCVSCRKRKLRCDRVKPQCGTCVRLRHECEFPERRRNTGSKRRNMKELEARLAQVETKLVSEVEAHKTNPTKSAAADIEKTWDIDVDIDSTLLDPAFQGEQFDFSFLNPQSSTYTSTSTSQEIISLGLDEPLPPQNVINELEVLYFEKFNILMPLIHKYRYYASLDLAPHMRPPVCLRYAMWTMAASLSEKYTHYEDILYRRSRKYIEAAEMKGFGETFVTIYHAQVWGILAHYEAKKTYFSRSWMSTGRMCRLVHMLGLHRIDGDKSDVKQILPPAKDWLELEERRRTFWCAFYCDRWASAGTGWPMNMNEKDIITNLPSSEISFEHGVEESTPSLAEAMTPGGASNISPYGGVIMAATLYGHNFEHLHRSGPNERPEDFTGGDFWKRHRHIDNVLSNTFMFLPDHLRTPYVSQDMNVLFMHMNIHASIICLHQAAIVTAQRYKLEPSVIRTSRTRNLMAAQEITNLMRMCSHVDAYSLNTWMGFCLYVAGGVCLQNATSENPHAQSVGDLEFLLGAMNALGRRHSITKHFTAQLELEISATGLATEETLVSCYFNQKDDHNSEIPLVPMSGLIYGRAGLPMTVDEMRLLSSRATKFSDTNGAMDKASPDMSNSPTNSNEPNYNTDHFPPTATVGTSGVSETDALYSNKPGVVEPPARVVSSFPSFTPMLLHTFTKGLFSGADKHSKSVADEIPNPNVLDPQPSYPLKFPFRQNGQGYQPDGAYDTWAQSQPQPQPQPRPPPDLDPSAFLFANPTWFDAESLNNAPPPNSELDALLDGIQWEPAGPNQP